MSSTHPLLVWMKEHHHTTDSFSVLLSPKREVTAESLRLISHGYRRPGWDLCFVIEEITEKSVTARELRDWRYSMDEEAA